MAELIQEVVAAPIVSADSNSPEAKLARDAARIQNQSATDSKYDTVLNRDGTEARPNPSVFQEGFSDSQEHISLPLVAAAIGFILFLAVAKR